MKRTRIISIVLAWSLGAVPGVAAANVISGLDTNDAAHGPSANEQIMLDAWKSPMHAFKAEALVGTV